MPTERGRGEEGENGRFVLAASVVAEADVEVSAEAMAEEESTPKAGVEADILTSGRSE